MILIISAKSEKTVNKVIEWLLFEKIKVVRIDELKAVYINFNTNFIELNDDLNFINTHSIISYWNRKGNLYFNSNSNLKEVNHLNPISNYLSNEWEVIKEIIIKKIEEKKHLGNYFLQIPNKLNHLSIAQKSGLEIPKTAIANNKEAIRSFKKESPNIINKSLSDSFTGVFNQVYYYNHTERVGNMVMEELEDSFFPSLFQEELQKAYELRIVFVQETLWSMAIFSQNDTKTQVDWRNYNHEKPNRKVPFKLPNEISEKVRKFIRASGLNTGAIDMVVTKDKKYVFLECNPNGQISMVSEHCNYYIEKYIAEYLSTP